MPEGWMIKHSLSSRQLVAQKLEEWRGLSKDDASRKISVPSSALSENFPSLMWLCGKALAKAVVDRNFSVLQPKDSSHPSVADELLDQVLWLAAADHSEALRDDFFPLFFQAFPHHRPESLLLARTGIKDQDLRTLSANSSLADLCHLDLSQTEFGQQAISGLRDAKGLETLWLSECSNLSDLSLRPLLNSSSKSLRELGLRNCSKISDQSIVALNRHTSLQTLDLGGIMKLSDEVLSKSLKNFTQLISLNLSGCSKVGSNTVYSLAPRTWNRGHTQEDEESEEPLDEGAAGPESSSDSDEDWESKDWDSKDDYSDPFVHSGCADLQALALCHCPDVTDGGIRELASCRSITELDLGHNLNISDSAIQAVIRACKLTVLLLPGCRKLTNRTLMELSKNCKGLSVLDVSYSAHFSDKGIAAVLAEALYLEALNIGYSPNFSDTALWGLAEGQGSRKLEELIAPAGQLSYGLLIRIVKEQRNLHLLVCPGLNINDSQASILYLPQFLKGSVVPKCWLTNVCSQRSWRGRENGGKNEGAFLLEHQFARLTVVHNWEMKPRTFTLPTFDFQ